MAIQIEKPDIEHKYITLFDTEEEFNAAYPNFEEVNWSDVAYPQERPDNYRVSRRLSNMYHKNTPPDYKFDNINDFVVEGDVTYYADGAYIGTFNEDDYTNGNIRKTFFLEIVWGYSGWEWHDYEKIIDPGEIRAATFKLYNRNLYMGLSETGVILTDQPYELTIEDNGDGTIYLTDGTYYVGLAGSDTCTMSSDPSKKAAITIEYSTIKGDKFVYLSNQYGYIGSDPYLKSDDSKCWANTRVTYAAWEMNITQGGPTVKDVYKGGNLYKIKKITTVPHIIDGDRLQHINDFLFSQYNVTKVEGFNTSSLVAANRAFKRGTNKDNSYPKRNTSNISECHLVDAYDGDTLVDRFFGYKNNLSKLVQADELFVNNKLYIGNDYSNTLPVRIPNIKKIDRLYSYSVYTDGLKFDMESLTELTNAFKMAIFPQSENPENASIDVNEIFVGETLDNITNFSGMFGGASIVRHQEVEGYNISIIKMDLTNSNAESDTVLNLSHFAEFVGPSEFEQGGNLGTSILSNTIVGFDLNFKNKVDLSYAFSNICREKSVNYDAEYNTNTIINSRNIRNSGFGMINLNFHDKESLITSIYSAFINNTFIADLPIQQVPNNNCNDSYIYQDCVFDYHVSYAFSDGLTNTLRPYYGQFNGCTIKHDYSFFFVNKLDRVEFCGIKFGENATSTDFPYVVQDQNDTTYRYFDMAFSEFTSISPQNIYIDTARFRLCGDKSYLGRRQNSGERINPFEGCSKFTDLSGVHLYYSDIDDRVEQIVTKKTQFNINYSSCTNLTKSPHIHFTYYRTWNHYLNVNFAGLKNLTDVNFENFNCHGYLARTKSGFTLQDCTNLTYLRISSPEKGFATQLDIRGCYNLDIPTLEATLSNMDDGQLQIMKSVWDQLSQSVKDHCLKVSIVTITKDSSYTPKYPD